MTALDDDPVTALTVALRLVVGDPQADWAALVAATGLPAATRHALLRAEPTALWDLATLLNEERTLPSGAS